MLKIAFYDLFGERKSAEYETLLRLKHCLQKEGHEFIIINGDGYVLEGENQGKHVEDIGVDFTFTYEDMRVFMTTIPDEFATFFIWIPTGIIAAFHSKLYTECLNLYDMISGYESAESRHTYNNSVSGGGGIFIPLESSVPKDFIRKPSRNPLKKLFYVGINLERAIKSMRYGQLFQKLDASQQIDIYGPQEVFGIKNTWAGFDCYRGEIPFDGQTIIEKINAAGICLALNSPIHNESGAVSNRIFEAAAAGAVIISDDNQFVHKYFGDTVFYVNSQADEDEAAAEILRIIDWVNSHPDEAYSMACQAQKIFVEQLNLDDMLHRWLIGVQTQKKAIQGLAEQPDIIDVICFVDAPEDYQTIAEQLSRQYYQNLHLIIVAETEVYDVLSSNISYSHDLVRKTADFKGESFTEAIPKLRGKYFMFMDKFSVLHKRHITKNHHTIKGSNELFVYSGCYLKSIEGDAVGKRYATLNSQKILRDEFLAFANLNHDNWEYKDQQCFFIETIFSRSAGLFKRDILRYADAEEMGQLSNNVHYYLACCSLIKAHMLGRFTYAMTTGYMGKSLEEVNQKVFHHRKYWHQNRRSAKTYIREMNEIFFKYTFETTPYFCPSRPLNIELICDTSAITTNSYSNREIKILQYIDRCRWANRVIRLLTRKKKAKYPQRDQRFINYFRKHHLIRNIYALLAK